MQVIHIGMGKTGTSSLQAHVFPRLAELGVVGAYNPPALCAALDGAVNGYVDEAEARALARALAQGVTHGAAQGAALGAAQGMAQGDIQRGALGKARGAADLFLSNETLIEWDPALWEAAADRLLRVFGPQAVIVITLRAPTAYLRSLYQQVVHAGKIRPPEEFFLRAAEYRAVARFLRPGELDALDVDAFDMARMVALYTERFARVLLVPFEAVGDLRFLTALWPAFEAQRPAVAAEFARAPRANASYSAWAMRLTLARARGLAGLGLRSLSASDRQREKALAHASGARLAKRRGVLPAWHRLMGLVSRYGPREGYHLPPDVPLGRHLAANMAFYETVRRAPDGYLQLGDGMSGASALGSAAAAGSGQTGPGLGAPGLGVGRPAPPARQERICVR